MNTAAAVCTFPASRSSMARISAWPSTEKARPRLSPAGRGGRAGLDRRSGKDRGSRSPTGSCWARYNRPAREAPFDRLERDPAIAPEQLARTGHQAGIVEALIVEVTVHAVEPRRDPTAARLEEGNANLRMAFTDAAPDHTHAGQHHFHRVRNDV